MDKMKFTRRSLFVTGWFAAAITTLLFAFTFSFYLSTTRLAVPQVQSFKLYAALPETENTISDTVLANDGRAKIIENFFVSYNSPLSSFSQNFVQVADKYQLDWRLLPAIAMQESNGAKKVVENSFNPFGYGIYGNLVIRFNSWEEAVEKVGKALRTDYLNQGLKTPYQIMTKYTPPSLALNGAWAKGVSSFMSELQ